MSDHQDKIPLRRVSVGLHVNKDNQAALGHVTGAVKFICIYLFPDSLVLEPPLTYQVAPVFLYPVFFLFAPPAAFPTPQLFPSTLWDTYPFLFSLPNSMLCKILSLYLPAF